MNQQKNKSITGQMSPLEHNLELRRKRALNSPFLSKDWKVEDVDVNYHGTVVNVNSSYLLVVVILVFADKGKFHWLVQSQFASKSSGKQIFVNLLSNKQKLALKKVAELAIAECGKKDTEVLQMKKGCRIWTYELTEVECAQIPSRFKVGILTNEAEVGYDRQES